MGVDVYTYVYVGAEVEFDEFFTESKRSLDCDCEGRIDHLNYCPICGNELGQTETIYTPKFPEMFLDDVTELSEYQYEDFWAGCSPTEDSGLHYVQRHSLDENGKWIVGVELRNIDSGLRGWSNEHCRQPPLPLHEIMSAFAKVEGLIAKYNLSKRDPIMIVAPYVSR